MNKKAIFIVQGEGRGHLTQAIAMQEKLQRVGVEVLGVLVGKSRSRSIPSFFEEAFSKVLLFSSPNFFLDKKSVRPRVWYSVLYHLMVCPRYFRSIWFIRGYLKKNRPSLVINFYEPLAALCFSFLKTECPKIAVAHQFVQFHSNFEFPYGSRSRDVFSLKLLTKVCSLGVDLLIGLSHTEMKNEGSTRLKICPPLIRKKVLDLNTKKGKKVLVYLLNHGILKEINQLAEQNQQFQFHCFVDKENVQYQTSPNLFQHTLDEANYFRYLADCGLLISTAGFETIAEVAYLGKQIIVKPVEGHFEQFCNSKEIERLSLGHSFSTFTGLKVEEFQGVENQRETYVNWVDSKERGVERIIMEMIS